MDYGIAHRRAVAASNAVSFMMLVPLLCLLVGFFITDGNVRQNLGKSFVYGWLAWFGAFLVTGCFILAFRLLKRLKRASDVSDAALHPAVALDPSRPEPAE